MNTKFKIIECPRDAMQGLSHFVATEDKIAYLNLLLQVGFDTLDFGSFVSPKAIPQMADTEKIVDKLELSSSDTKLLAIVANGRGVENACSFPSISYLGFPLSISETFQQRNTNASIQNGLEVVKMALEKCARSNKELVVYLSMAFGNPYGDAYSEQTVLDFTGKLQEMGTKIISLADTVGLASKKQVYQLGKAVSAFAQGTEIGMHLHARPETSLQKIEAAWKAGIRRLDVALGGLGGCPMAEDELVGNISTESLLVWTKGNQEISLQWNHEALSEASRFLQERILA